MRIISSGRTDRYVHALSLPIVIRGEHISKEPSIVMEELNEVLPKDIRILDCVVREDKFNPKNMSIGKKYRYLIDTTCSKDSNYYYNYDYKVDLNLLIEDSKLFIGEKDFASFTAKENYESFVREVTFIDVTEDNGVISIDIQGKGFMRFMVRNIVGILLAHNRGEISKEEFIDLFNNPEKGKAHYKVNGSGLYLVEVYY